MVSDEKWLRYEAVSLARRKGIGMDEAMEILSADPALSKPEELMRCPVCGVEVKGKNFARHRAKHPTGQKINWGNIPIIKRQRAERKRLREAAGSPKVHFVSGGAPSLGKKK